MKSSESSLKKITTVLLMIAAMFIAAAVVVLDTPAAYAENNACKQPNPQEHFRSNPEKCDEGAPIPSFRADPGSCDNPQARLPFLCITEEPPPEDGGSIGSRRR